MAKCDNCEYEWEYGGNMVLATCPSCNYKVRVEPNDE